MKPLPWGREHQRYRRRAMTEEEIERFLAASEEDDEHNGLRLALEGLTRVPQTPMWIAFLETGARWSELRLATWGDLNLKRRILVLKAENTKSRKQRAIPLRQELVDRLVQLRALHENVLGRLPNVAGRILLTPEGANWCRPTNNAMRIFDRLLNAAGIPKVDAEGRKLDIHALRTTCASRMARAGVPMEMTRRLLGHSSVQMTAEVYTDLSVEDMRAAVEDVPALGGESSEAKAN